MKRQMTAIPVFILGLMMCVSVAQAALVGGPPLPPPPGGPPIGDDPPFTFTFSIDGNVGYGNLDTLPYSGGQYHAISGTLYVTAGAAVGTYGLLTAGPGSTTSPTGAFIADNLIVPATDPFLTTGGLLFGNGTQEVNIWENYAGNYSFYRWTASGNNYDVATTADGSFVLTAVPIPPAVLLLGSGLMSLFGFARRKSPSIEAA